MVAITSRIASAVKQRFECVATILGTVFRNLNGVYNGFVFVFVSSVELNLMTALKGLGQEYSAYSTHFSTFMIVAATDIKHRS
jgi:hypothetical protein